MKKTGWLKKLISMVKIPCLVALALTLSFLSFYFLSISNKAQAGSIDQYVINPLTSSSTFEEIKERLLITNDTYKTLSFNFNEWDQRFTSEKIITDASVTITQKPVPKVKMVANTGALSQPRFSFESISDGTKTLTFFKDLPGYSLYDTYINPRPDLVRNPDDPPYIVLPKNNGTQIPEGADIDLAVHPELLVGNKIFNQEFVTILGEEKIGERNTLKSKYKFLQPVLKNLAINNIIGSIQKLG